MVSESELRRRIGKVEDRAGTSQKPKLIVRGPLLWCIPGSNAGDISKGCLAAISCRRSECDAEACPDYEAPKAKE